MVGRTTENVSRVLRELGVDGARGLHGLLSPYWGESPVGAAPFGRHLPHLE